MGINLIEKLEAIVRRPALYMGNSNNHFQSLNAFMSGYSFGLKASMKDEFIPPDFNEFVTHYYIGEWRLSGGRGWMTFIEENTENSEESLQKFLELRKLYEDTNLEELRD